MYLTPSSYVEKAVQHGGPTTTKFSTSSLPSEGRRMNSRIDATQGVRDAMQGWRSLLGDGIGNLRIVDTSVNRGDGDTSLPVKMRCLSETNLTFEGKAMMEAIALDPMDRALWLAASTPEDRWDESRLAAFQSAVERRSAWLYCN